MKRALVLVWLVMVTPISAGAVPSFESGAWIGDAFPEARVVASQPLFEDVSASIDGVALTPSGADGVAPSFHVPVYHATEPGTLVLLGTGLLGIATLLRRRAS